MDMSSLNIGKLLSELQSLFFICGIKQNLSIELAEEPSKDSLLLHLFSPHEYSNKFDVNLKISNDRTVYLRQITGDCTKQEIDRIIEVVKCWVNAF